MSAVSGLLSNNSIGNLGLRNPLLPEGVYEASYDPITLRVVLEGVENRKIPISTYNWDLSQRWTTTSSNTWTATASNYPYYIQGGSQYTVMNIPRESNYEVVDFLYRRDSDAYFNSTPFTFTVWPDHVFSEFSVYMLCRDFKVMNGKLARVAATNGPAPLRVGYEKGAFRIPFGILAGIPRNLRIRELP